MTVYANERVLSNQIWRLDKLDIRDIMGCGARRVRAGNVTLGAYRSASSESAKQEPAGSIDKDRWVYHKCTRSDAPKVRLDSEGGEHNVVTVFYHSCDARDAAVRYHEWRQWQPFGAYRCQ